MIGQNGKRLHTAPTTSVKSAHIPHAGCAYRLFRLYCSLRRGIAISARQSLRPRLEPGAFSIQTWCCRLGKHRRRQGWL